MSEGLWPGGQGGGLGAQIIYVGVGFPSRIQCIPPRLKHPRLAALDSSLPKQNRTPKEVWEYTWKSQTRSCVCDVQRGFCAPRLFWDYS